MKTFAFTVAVHDAPPDLLAIQDVLYESGCDDALLRMTGEEVFLDFDRESTNIEHAIQSALRNIHTAGFLQTTVVSIDSDVAAA